MRAERSRAGGKFLSRERGAQNEVEPELVAKYRPPPLGGPIIFRLDASSLALVAEMLGIDVMQLEERYGASH